MVDVWFAKDKPGAADRVQMQDLLAAPTADLLGGASPPPQVASAAAPTAMLIDRRQLLDDDLRQHSLI